MISLSSFGIRFQEQSEEEERLLTDDEEIPMSGSSEVAVILRHFASIFLEKVENSEVADSRDISCPSSGRFLIGRGK